MRHLFVAGRPAPQGSKSIGRSGQLYETSRHLKPWRETVRLAAQLRRLPMIEGPVVLGMEFVMPRPKSTPTTRPTPPATRRPDIEKLARAISDALTGVSFADDSQVTVMPLAKRIAEPGDEPGVNIYLAQHDSTTVAEVVHALYGLTVFPCCTDALE